MTEQQVEIKKKKKVERQKKKDEQKKEKKRKISLSVSLSSLFCLSRSTPSSPFLSLFLLSLPLSLYSEVPSHELNTS